MRAIIITAMAAWVSGCSGKVLQPVTVEEVRASKTLYSRTVEGDRAAVAKCILRAFEARRSIVVYDLRTYDDRTEIIGRSEKNLPGETFEALFSGPGAVYVTAVNLSDDGDAVNVAYRTSVKLDHREAKKDIELIDACM